MDAREVREQMSVSNWMKGRDKIFDNGKNVKVTIASVEIAKQKDKDGNERPQYVLKFNGTEKQLGLNVGNTDSMINIHGWDDTQWPGKEIILFTAPTKSPSGETVPGIKVKSTKQEEVVALGEIQESPQEDVDVSNIPF